MSRATTLLVVFALALAMLLAAPTPILLAQDDSTPTPISPERVLERAQEALQRAESVAQDSQKTLETVSRMLSFLESAGQAIGIVLTLATTVGATVVAFLWRRANKALERAEQLRADAERTLREIERRGADTTRAASLLQIGVQQMLAHSHDAALQTFEEAHKLDPNNRAVSYYLGELYTQKGDLERAIELLRASGGEFPPSEAALGYALRRKAEREQQPERRNQLYAQAEQHLLNALSRDPQVRDINGASFYGALGGLYRRQGRLEDAVRAYEAASRVTPHSSYPLNNLALLHLRQGKLEQADQMFRRSARIAARAVDGDPFDHWARFDLLTAHVALGEYDKAEEQVALLYESPPSAGALELLLGGLETVQRSPRGTAHSAQIVERVKALIERQRSA
ncbi:MAG: tetratricopeptide repeat protein [Chloroflexi bacterium]|nr:tetratricopeptide repeat protein [Chloroflexota bacterium]